jgi:hypothetical protein
MFCSKTATALAASFIAASSFAATDASRGTSVSHASRTSLISQARRNLVSLQILGISNRLSESVPGETASMNGTSAAAGVSLGMESMVSRRFSIETNLGVLRKKYDSTHHNGQTQDMIGDASVKLSTVRLAVLARYHFIPAISIGAGAYGSQFVGPAILTSASGVRSNESADGIYREDYGLTFGARGEIPVAANLSFIADARYYWGLRNLNSSVNPNDDPDLSIKTRDIEIAAGAGLRF